MNTQTVHRYMSTQQRFDTQYIPVPESGCWIWVGTTVRGYGQFQVSSTRGRQLAHRYSLEQKLGRPILSGMLACHKCDIPLCVNPEHLYEGTFQSNADDKVFRNRQSKGDHVKNRCRGVNHHSAILTEKDVLQIRQSKDTEKNLSDKYRISVNSIRKVLRFKTWRHITQMNFQETT